MTFSDIAVAFLKEQGYEPHLCQSEEEARVLAAGLSTQPAGTPPRYPVFFFTSDTSGEKAYEEFWTDGEEVDLERHDSLGVIKNAPRRSIEEIRQVTSLLDDTLRKPGITKAEIVRVLSRLIPNFEHIETGKGLDQKM